MEQAAGIIIYIHAFFGAVALLVGLVSLIAKKGKNIHRKSGLVFFYSMLVSLILAMLVSVLPQHESPFLLAIGIFSLYFVLTGYRALRFKRKDPGLSLDRWISRLMILTGLLMIFLPVLLTGNINVILLVFAVIGILVSVMDLRLYRNPGKLRKNWLKLHLGKMLGGYIAATTAFVVVNQFLPGFYAWFAPSVIGWFFIAYWTRKVSRKKPVVKRVPRK